MEQKIFLDSIYQSMQDSAREARLLLGRVHHRMQRDSKPYNKLQC